MHNDLSQVKIEQAIELAKNFKGQHNSDWTPFIAKLGEIVPNAPLPEIDMCLVPVGNFMMGSEEHDKEKPPHPQNISHPYWIARYPVTNAEWHKAVEANIVNQPKDYGNALNWYKDAEMANAPVVGVTWFECLKFSQWLQCNLPSELIWEYAARGIDNLRYSWGNDFDKNKCIYAANSGKKPNPVASKPEGASWVGTMHMIGNIWEWQLNQSIRHKAIHEHMSYIIEHGEETTAISKEDIYPSDYPYNPNDGREEDLDEELVDRVWRGGSFKSVSHFIRTTYRLGEIPTLYDEHLGFRICLHFDSE